MHEVYLATLMFPCNAKQRFHLSPRGCIVAACVVMSCALLGCGATSASATATAPTTAESVEQELVRALETSANTIHDANTALKRPALSAAEHTAITSKLLRVAQSLLDNHVIVRGCAKLVRYQEYGSGMSFAKYACERHYDKERWLQLHDILRLFTWYPAKQSTNFAMRVVHDVHTSTHLRSAAISTLEALAVGDPALAVEAAAARSELDARARFRADNAHALSNLSRNLELCFTGRDRDLDLLFEVNSHGDVVRIHSPSPNTPLERCVISYTFDETFRMQSKRNLVFRIHVIYRSNI